jgi:L-ascorbate metabolism protein UlaG (beta-lactamase superfamily)
MSLTYRWLGVAGLEFTFQDFTLLIDPFFTRPGKATVLAGRRVRTDAELVKRHISRADAVLVTHAHYDHLLDVPEVMRKTGARAFGSPNTCTLLALHGISSGNIQTILVGDRFQLGPFTVDVFPNHHTRIPFSRWFNGPLPAGLRNGPARLPLRLSDYRMDACYSFNIQIDGLVMQIGKHPAPADALFISPYRGARSLESTLQAVRPKWIVPIHWDDFMRPLSLPLRTMLLTPAQGLRHGLFPFLPLVRRLNLQDFTDAVQQIMPETDVRVPKIFEVYHV